MQTILKIVFFIVTAAVYPLLFYIIVPWSNSFKDFSESTDPAGGGMATGFSFYYGCLFSFIIWLVLSSILAHWCVRAWWIGLLALIVSSIEAYKKHQADHLLHPYEKHYETGMIREKGNYIGRKSSENKHGKITQYYPDGTIKSVDTYEKGEPSGPCELYYPDGKLMVKGGLKGSEWNDGEQIGIPDGDWIYYRKDGSIDDERTYAKVQVNNGQYEGDFCSYYTTGDDLIVAATATYANGKLNGQLKKYHTNGQLKTNAVYVNGKIEGNYTIYYADSIVKRPYGKIEYTCSYKNGNRNGVGRWYYKNGMPEEETEYLEGKREGISRKYYQDGKPSSIYNYRNGEKDGVFQSYDVDGSYEKGSYEKGEISLREKYRADGTLISIYQWRNGNCIRSDNYDQNGNLKCY